MTNSAKPALTAAGDEQFLGYVLVLASALGSCCVALFAKFAYGEGLNLTSILFWRYLISAGVLLALYFTVVKKRLNLQMTAVCLVMGMVGHAFSAICFFNSIQRVLASVSSVLLYTFPAMVVLLLWLIERKMPSWRSLIALVVSFVGCVFVISSGGVGSVDALGVVYGLGSAFFYAGFIVVSRPILRGADPIAVSAIAILGAALVLVGLSLVSTVFPVITMLFGIKRIGPAQASIVSTSEPVFTLILSYILLDERLSAMQLMGSALIVLSLLMLAIQKRRKILR